ncbi:MAG: hypothetical protein QW779_06315 [Nitrososphaerales archaeon]
MPKVLDAKIIIEDILMDQKWHTISELAKATSKSEEVVEKYIRFLAMYDWVTYDEKERKVLIHHEFKEIPSELKSD